MGTGRDIPRNTLETNSEFTPENRPGPKRKRSYSNHPFSGAILVLGRVINGKKLEQLPAPSTKKPYPPTNHISGDSKRGATVGGFSERTTTFSTVDTGTQDGWNQWCLNDVKVEYTLIDTVL